MLKSDPPLVAKNGMENTENIPVDPLARRAAAREASRVIDKASGRERDPLHPLPLFSLESARIVLTMDGRFSFIVHDANGNARMGPAGYTLAVVSIVSALGPICWAATL